MTLEELQKLLIYNPDTGEFTRISDGKILNGKNTAGYKRVTYCKKQYSLHRLAFLYMTGALPKQHVDHINGNRADNRWANLRDVSNKTNSQNTRKASKNNLTGYLGVYKYYNKYRASICIDGKSVMLGSFKTPEEASNAYLKAKQVNHPGFVI